MRTSNPFPDPGGRICVPARGTLLSAIFFAFLGSVQAEPSDTDYVSRARSYMNTGELKSASLELKHALQEDPGSQDARWLLGQVYLGLGQGESAEKEIERARTLGLSDTESQPALVHANYMKGDMDRVIESSQELAPGLSLQDQALVLGFRGRALVEKGRIDEAQAVLDQGLDIDSRSPDVLTGMALLSLSRKNIADTHSRLARALDADPTYADAWTLLGNLALAEGNAVEAESSLDKAIELRKYPNPDRAQRAMARLRLGNVAGAEADVQALKEAGFRQHPLVTRAAGLVALDRRDFAAAAEAFEASYAAKPNEQVALLLAATYLLSGNPNLALFYSQKLTALAQGAGRQLLATVQILDPGYSAVEPPLRAALEKNPGDPSLLDLLGRIALLRGNSHQAVVFYRRLAQLQPESEAVGNVLMLAELLDGGRIDDASDFGSNATTTTQHGDYARAFLKALETFRDRKFDAALGQARALATRYPDEVDPINLVAACRFALGQLGEVRLALEDALKLKPNDPTTRTNLAKVELAEGNLQRARELVEAVVRSAPKRADAVRLLAAIDAKLAGQDGGTPSVQPASDGHSDEPGVLERARAELAAGHATQALALLRDLSQTQLEQDPRLLGIKGRAELVSGDLPAATGTLARWTQIDPKSADARFYFAESLARSGDFGQASEQLSQAVALDPGHLLAGIGEVKALTGLRKIDEAEVALTALKKRFGDTPYVLAVDGWFALGTGQYERAVSSFAAAAAKRPNTDVTILWARALAAQSKHQEAVAMLRDWQTTHPEDLAAVMELADLLLGSGREGDAKEIYAKALALAPDNVIALNNLAWLIRGENPSKAIDLAQRAYTLAPEDAGVLDTLGMLLSAAGDPAIGYRHIGRAAELAPEDPQIQLHWGRALLQMGRGEEARAVLDGLAAHSPGSPQAREARAMLDASPRH